MTRREMNTVANPHLNLTDSEVNLLLAIPPERLHDTGELYEQHELPIDWNDPLERARVIWAANPTELDWR